jgi:protein phosphatase 2C family protein 2/3
VGPYRVFPGRLSVSRTFGDIEAKLTQFGGLPGVVVATPEITSFKIKPDLDFLVLGCKYLNNPGDGIFDQLTNKEVSDCVFLTLNEDIKEKNIHCQSALAVDMIMKSSLVRKTLDNITCVLLVFEHFESIWLNRHSENLSPKSSFYLHSVLDNKEQDNNYIKTEPDKIRYKKTVGISPNPRITSIKMLI